MFNASISNRQNELQDQDERDVGRRRESLGAVLFLIIGMMMGVDLFGDAETGADWEHLLVEAMVMALAIVGVVALWRGFWAAQSRAATLGLSLEVVAEARNTSEATVRQQALVVYRKSGLRSRSDLSAYFLEDLLLPRSAPGAPQPEAR